MAIKWGKIIRWREFKVDSLDNKDDEYESKLRNELIMEIDH